ncbi:MAG TPA: hypothetical protein DHT34_07390, partial [Cellvibrionales bacterium]|nr:hypothetical protein [Cellvibrionales bacterium]
PTTDHEPPILIDLVNDIAENNDLSATSPQAVKAIQQRVAEFQASITIAPSIFDRQKEKQTE